jgi:hypothetical protein
MGWKDEMAQALDIETLRKLAAQKSDQISEAVRGLQRFRMENDVYLGGRGTPQALEDIRNRIYGGLLDTWAQPPPEGTRWPSNDKQRDLILAEALQQSRDYQEMQQACLRMEYELKMKEELVEQAKRERADVMFAWMAAIHMLAPETMFTEIT